MPFRDNLVLFRSRLAANLPQASLANQSVFMGFAQAFLSADADTQALIRASQPDLFLSTASGTALDRKAADYGVRRQGGLSATVKLTFFLDTPPSTLVTIPAGTIVSTVGDGLTTDSIFFSTTEASTIEPPLDPNATGPTLAGVGDDPNRRNFVWALATIVGAAGNVSSHTILNNNTGLMGGLLRVDNALPAYGGQDPQSDLGLRSAAQAALLSKYAPRALEAALLAVNGVFDAYVQDPQDGGGSVNIYWADLDGNQPGMSFSGLQAQFAPNTLADKVNVAAVAVLPPNILAAFYPFQVFEVTPSATYMAPPGYQTSIMTPLIQQAIADYINGLRHNQAATLYGLVQFVSARAGNILVDFVPQVSPSLATTEAFPTVLYRYSGDASAITVIRQF